MQVLWPLKGGRSFWSDTRTCTQGDNGPFVDGWRLCYCWPSADCWPFVDSRSLTVDCCWLLAVIWPLTMRVPSFDFWAFCCCWPSVGGWPFLWLLAVDSWPLTFDRCYCCWPFMHRSWTLQEMVGAAGPLRTGDEVDFLLPPPPPGGKPQETTAGNPSGGGRAVGTVRVQVGAAACPGNNCLPLGLISYFEVRPQVLFTSSHNAMWSHCSSSLYPHILSHHHTIVYSYTIILILLGYTSSLWFYWYHITTLLMV